MLRLLEISLAELGRTAEKDLKISGDSYATQRRIEDGRTQNCSILVLPTSVFPQVALRTCLAIEYVCLENICLQNEMSVVQQAIYTWYHVINNDLNVQFEFSYMNKGKWCLIS